MQSFDFSNFDFSTVGDGTGVDLPSGVYAAQVQSAELTASPEKGTPQYEFKLVVTDPRFAGAIRTNWITLPNDPNSKVIYIWIRAFNSVGVTNEQLKQAGGVPFDQIPALFTGRNCYFQYVKGNRDLGQRDKVSFLTEAAYVVKRKAQDAQAAAAPAAVASSAAVTSGVTVTQAPNQQPALPATPALNAGAPAKGAQDLMALLGGNAANA